MTPTTSVIVTCYDYARFLPAAIASVLGQTDADLELLVVDDGSTDESVAVASRAAASDARVRVLAEPHRGCGAARNAGLRAARGRYVAFLDADDVWTRGKLAAQRARLDARPDVGLVYARFGTIDAEGRVRSRGRTFGAARPSGFIFRDLLAKNVIGTPSVVCFRRDLVTGPEALLFDETGAYMDDWHFYLRLALGARARYIPRTLAYHRQHGRNVTRDVDLMHRQNLATGRFAVELARRRLRLGERAVRRLARRADAYAEALAGRECAKAGDWPRARSHARAALRHHPLNLREAALYVFASIGFLPGAVARRLQ